MLDRALVVSSLAYLIVTTPVITYCNSSERRSKERKKWTLMALGIVVALFAVKFGFDLVVLPKNYYEALEVPRHASAMAIRKSYVKLSKSVHPDKNPAPDAKERFDEMTRMKEVNVYFVIFFCSAAYNTLLFIVCCCVDDDLLYLFISECGFNRYSWMNPHVIYTIDLVINIWTSILVKTI